MQTSVEALPPLVLPVVQTGFNPEALEELRAAVGAEFVSVSLRDRMRRERTTLPVGVIPSAIVRPGSTAEVQAVMRAAARWELSLHPISTGRNWGYGDACAPKAGQVLLDLGRMNRILEINQELAYVTLEPGVTQGQVAEEVERRGLPLWMDATGAGPQTSVIGNIMERGFGHSPHGDRFAHCCGMEIVLPDGRLLRTGFGHYAGARTANVYAYGVGPALDGLFTQSNFGVVTRLTFWLLPKPETFRAFFFSVWDHAALGHLIEALRPLRQRGTLRTPIHICNDLRMLSLTQSYPWQEMGGHTPLAPDIRAMLCRRHELGAWSGSGGLYGSAGEVAAAANEVRRALQIVPGVRMIFLDERRLRWAGYAAAVLRKLGVGAAAVRLLEKLRMGFDLLRGKPPVQCGQGGLWQVRAPLDKPLTPDVDPLDAGAGFAWISPVLPMTSADAARVNVIGESVMSAHGFDYLVTHTLINPRALCAVMTISFDKSDPAACARATACHDELLERLIRAGYPPYRAGRMSMSALRTNSEVYFDVVRELKRALDPQGLISPGHYV